MRKIQLIIITAAALLLMQLTSRADHISVSGEVSGIWEADTVFVTADIIIPPGLSLLIDPGTRVIFNRAVSFQVNGGLAAEGTAEARIVFTVADTSGFTIDSIPEGGWKGISVDGSAGSGDSLRFSYCSFFYGKASGDSSKMNGGAIAIRDFDKIRITNCIFESNFAAINGGAIYLVQADVMISKCEFINNVCGHYDDPYGYGGAICSDSSSCRISECVFTLNSSTGIGGAVAIRFRDAWLYNNIFTLNYSALGGAIGYLHYYENNYTQSNNLVYENSSAFFGGGIANIDAGPVFVNNTIDFNTSVYGGGFYVKDSIIADVHNCIIWGNTALSTFGPQVYLWDYNATANFYYCDIQDGREAFGGSGGGTGYQGIYENNMDVYPEFVNSTDHNYALFHHSACVNAGTPDKTGLLLPAYTINNLPRILEGRIDIGCYENDIASGINRNGENRKQQFTIWPNPASEYIFIECGKAPGKLHTITISDINGKPVLSEYLPAASRRTMLDIGLFKPGFYIIRFGTETEIFSGSFVKE